MKNKGFTLVELLGVIILLTILSTMAVVSVMGYLDNAKNSTYEDFEKTMKSSTINYFIEHSIDLPAIGSKVLVSANRLIEYGYLTTMRDPEDDGLNCDSESYVVVTRENDASFNLNVNYDVCLICKKHKSDACLEDPSSIKTLE